MAPSCSARRDEEIRAMINSLLQRNGQEAYCTHYAGSTHSEESKWVCDALHSYTASAASVLLGGCCPQCIAKGLVGEFRRPEGVVKVVVPVSGGKDSQACLKLALQRYSVSEVRGMFNDTGFEHPQTYAHVYNLRKMYGDVSIDVTTGGTVDAKVLKYSRFPGGGARHCTSELKLKESKIYYKELAVRQGTGFEVWSGVRSGESSQRAARYNARVSEETYAPHELNSSHFPKYLARMGVMYRLPILDWSEEAVKMFLAGEMNPLYAEGFSRVGCFPCLASGDAWKEKAFAHDAFGAAQKDRVDVLAKTINKSIWTSKGGKARNEDTPPCAFCSI